MTPEMWSGHMDRLLSDVKVLLTLPDDNFSSGEKQKYILQFLDCLVFCAGEEKKRYESLVEQSDHDIVDLEHLYVFKKKEEEGGRSIRDCVRNIPGKWENLNSDEIGDTLMNTLVERRIQKDLMTVYNALFEKITLAKNVLSHMDNRVYTVGKTTNKKPSTCLPTEIGQNGIQK